MPIGVIKLTAFFRMVPFFRTRLSFDSEQVFRMLNGRVVRHCGRLGKLGSLGVDVLKNIVNDRVSGIV